MDKVKRRNFKVPNDKKPLPAVIKNQTLGPSTNSTQPYSADPNQLIAMALDKNLDMDKLERLIAMKEKFEAQIRLQAYNEAFSTFQKNCPELRKNVEVDYGHKNGPDRTNYKYHDLPGIAKTIRPALADSGLAYRWEHKELPDGKISVCCVITHKDGHIERGEPLSAVDDTTGKKTGLHAKGSTMTYLERYTLKAILGLSSADPDDDAAMAVRQAKKEEHSGDVKIVPNPKQIDELCNAIMDGTTSIEEAQKHYMLTDGQVKVLEKAKPKYPWQK